MGRGTPAEPRKSSIQSANKPKKESKITLPNGDRYVGEIKDGQLDGQGTIYYKNGDMYKGEWHNNQKNGFGTQNFQKDQKRYVGNWLNNLYHGEGTLYYPNGSYFTGKFLKGEKHGQGKYVDPQGDGYDEEWEHGQVKRRLLPTNQPKEENSLQSSSNRKLNALKDDEDTYSKTKENYTQRSNLRSLDYEGKECDDSDKKHDDASNEHEKEAYEKHLNSNILFKSHNDYESGEGRAYDVGLDTLNVIEHIDMLNSAAGTLLNKHIQEWTTEDIGEWLRHIGLDEYIKAFQANHITGAILFDITEADLKDEFKMMSVGHRKNFMKAVTNLKKIFSGSEGKDSNYIKQKIQNFYDKNKQKPKIGLLSNMGNNGNNDNRFYSQKFYTKNLYNSNQQILEESDEHSVKFDTSSPKRDSKDDKSDHFDTPRSNAHKKAPHSRGSGSERKHKSRGDFEEEEREREDDDGDKEEEEEEDEELFPAKTKVSKDGSKASSKESEHKQVSSKQALDQKLCLARLNTDTHTKSGSPNKNIMDKKEQGDTLEDIILENNPQQAPVKNEKESLNSPDLSSSSSSSDTDTSEDEKPKPDEKAKEESLQALDGSKLKVVKVDPKIEKKHTKKNNSASVNNFKSAEFTVKSKQNIYKEDAKKKRHRNRRKGDLESINQKIKDDIIRKFKESGMNENFIIDYNELFFEQKIGEGGYGRVYLGKFSGIDVAIKEYGKRQLNKKCAEDFVKEVEVISNLRHPNIVLYMGACIHNGKYLMITEYLEEGSLFDQLHKKHTKINEDVMFNIIEDIALGMCYLHGRKVMHCDLKSSNILIDSSWSVKLCDFGLSRVKYKSDKKRFAKQRVGTPNWMAPEILRGEKYDEAADVYSFGMVLWEMATGEIPYYNVKIPDIISTVGIEGKQVPLPTKGHPLILSLIKSCLSLEKNARPTFKEIVGQLQQIQQRNKNASGGKKNEIFNFFGN